MKKNHYVKFLVLTVAMAIMLCLLLSACGNNAPTATDAPDTKGEVTQTEQPQDGEGETAENPVSQTTERFDERMVGAWYCYESSNDGDMNENILSQLRNLEFFLPDGTVSLSPYFLFRDLYMANIESPILHAANGKIDFGENIQSFLLKNGIDQAELDKYSEVQITYEFFDYTGEQAAQIYTNESTIRNYDLYTDDGLIIHITASYHENPLSTKSIDLTYRYYKDFYNDRFMAAYLVGTWNDDSGNTWSFDYSGVDEYDIPQFVFSMTEANGAVHNGKSHGAPYYTGATNSGETNELGYVSFYFEDFNSPEYKVESFDMNTIRLNSDAGGIVLTRA